ncbi:hypothetical protein BH20VER1_BH20VER1_06300 [soil metagenome]
MEWLPLGLAAAAVLLALLAWFVWRRWVQPWRQVEDLLGAIAESNPPHRFLMSGNLRASSIGLNAEKIATRLQELEKRAEQGEFSVQAVFGAMLDGLAVVDVRRRVRMANTAFARIFGPASDPTGTPLLEVISHASVDRLVAAAIADCAPRQESIQISRGPSEGREFEVTAVPLSGSSSGAQGAAVLFHDVTQMRLVEEMRRDFVANVSHELRTPLSIFRGYLETLLDNPKQPPGELLRILEVMERHSDRLNALVEDVLTLARLESPDAELELEEIDVREFLETVAGDWRPRFDAKELRAELHLPPDLPLLCADERRLQEVIYNLLDNALKYSRPGGRVTIRAERKDQQVQLSVGDEGVGIREADLPRIFERFYRADKARSPEGVRGTGLGLSIVKHIAQLHGGSVAAESQPGRGTTISVLLPITGPPERIATPT